MTRQFAPAIGGYFAFFGVETDNNVASKSAAGIVQEARVFNCRRADNDVINAVVKVALNGVQVTNATANLYRNAPVDGFQNGFDRTFIFRFASKGAVQIDQMQPARALGQPVFGHGRRVIGKDGGGVHVALFQAYTLAVFEVDSRYEQHDLRLPVDEIAVQLQAVRGTFLWMKLGSKNIIACNGAGKG